MERRFFFSAVGAVRGGTWLIQNKGAIARHKRRAVRSAVKPARASQALQNALSSTHPRADADTVHMPASERFRPTAAASSPVRVGRV
jgi:gamma-glutamyl:cysteine ligase YbdK (ATP-grasp superfamily)